MTISLCRCTVTDCTNDAYTYTPSTIDRDQYGLHFAAAWTTHVTEIQCTFGSSNSIGSRDSIVARLRKPDGFKGHPLFADDRAVDPETDPSCQIRPDPTDQTALKYNLRINDFSRCGVLRRNGFVHVRVWFPQFPGVVMQSDQELIIMCKPPEPTVIENKAAGFAGSFPHGARVSGVVEETPGRLEYEVALYKEAPAARISNNSTTSELPVDQAVPIGTKLQLRARISPESAWKYVKLMEVTVSPDPDDPHMMGSVALVKDGTFNSLMFEKQYQKMKPKEDRKPLEKQRVSDLANKQTETVTPIKKPNKRKKILRPAKQRNTVPKVQSKRTYTEAKKKNMFHKRTALSTGLEIQQKQAELRDFGTVANKVLSPKTIISEIKRDPLMTNVQELRCTNVVKIGIYEKPNNEPVCCKLYKASVKEREDIKEIVTEWKKQEIQQSILQSVLGLVHGSEEVKQKKAFITPEKTVKAIEEIRRSQHQYDVRRFLGLLTATVYTDASLRSLTAMVMQKDDAKKLHLV
ncbi:hypothetical protein ILUMI_06323 [Ignelater luminosus]|uniref:Uncharacterized protein n=1 Tax=Ignelater luminosus TaxID=2038154 RepID=A0A8K0D9G6_IGNLU|nr:hypothetical protein ILUMI_06323 [Ignelater luminosus]